MEKATVTADEKRDIEQLESDGFGEELGPINASGHVQELDRNFNFLSILGMALCSGNTWIGLGGTIVVAINNGGPPGVIYEFIAASFFYWLIAASLAELASAVPSAGGVYHWASITAGRHGLVVGFFAGWLNFLGWFIALASISQINAAIAVSMWALYHPGFAAEKWHVFIAYLTIIWGCFALVLWQNRLMPVVQRVGGFLAIAGAFVTVIVCLAMARGRYASTAFVWTDWANASGWDNDGFVFCLGMLNGAFTVGTPDLISHLAEEVPRPSVNLPKAVLGQYVIGFTTAFTYAIGIFYSVSDLTSVQEAAKAFPIPLTEIYRQATGTREGATCLLVLFMGTLMCGTIGTWLTCSRVFWTLARDNATPFSNFFRQINTKNRNPSNSIMFNALLATALGCIYLGSATAFNAFVGSFVVLTTISYLLTILPHLLSRRSSVKPGYFWMGKAGYVVNAVSCLYIAAFAVIFCFPLTVPTSAEFMNYTCLITGGLSIFVAGAWFWKWKVYKGPPPFQAEVSARDAL